MGLSDPKCDQCGKQPATVRFTQVEGGKVRKGRLCAACARARGLLDIAPLPGSRSLLCGTCGLAFSDFQQQGRLGCPACYMAFAAELAPLLRQIHGHAEQHPKPAGRSRTSGPVDPVASLRAELESAVRAEDYERAATLRDRIRALEQAPQSAAGESESSPGKPPPQETR